MLGHLGVCDELGGGLGTINRFVRGGLSHLTSIRCWVGFMIFEFMSTSLLGNEVLFVLRFGDLGTV